VKKKSPHQCDSRWGGGEKETSLIVAKKGKRWRRCRRKIGSGKPFPAARKEKKKALILLPRSKGGGEGGKRVTKTEVRRRKKEKGKKHRIVAVS